MELYQGAAIYKQSSLIVSLPRRCGTEHGSATLARFRTSIISVYLSIQQYFPHQSNPYPWPLTYLDIFSQIRKSQHVVSHTGLPSLQLIHEMQFTRH
jgi:hypothetical protein